jgi:ABC-type transporter Mla MlaB component
VSEIPDLPAIGAAWDRIRATRGLATTDTTGPVAVLTVTGEIDAANSEQVENLLMALRKTTAAVAIGLADVATIDSSGISVLLRGRSEARDARPRRASAGDLPGRARRQARQLRNRRARLGYLGWPGKLRLRPCPYGS